MAAVISTLEPDLHMVRVCPPGSHRPEPLYFPAPSSDCQRVTAAVPIRQIMPVIGNGWPIDALSDRANLMWQPLLLP